MLDRRIIAVIIAIIILLLLWWMFQPTQTANVVDPDWSIISSHSNSGKLHETEFNIPVISFEDCCDGDIKVLFEHDWDFYHSDVPDDACGTDKVKWIVRDSSGREVFSSSEGEPTSESEIITDGVWDCVHPWVVVIENKCVPPISFEYTLTLYCFN